MKEHYGPRLTPKAVSDLERSFELDHEAWALLRLVVAEWESDPMSVQCFDLRIVERATNAVKEYEKLDILR